RCPVHRRVPVSSLADASAMTLDEIVRRNALRFPTKRAVVAPGHSLTWAELDARVDRVAVAMREAGLISGQRVAILLGNCHQSLELYMACARAELIAVPVNYRLTAHEASVILRQAAPQLLVFGAVYEATAREVAASVAAIRMLWVLDDANGHGA